MSNTDESAGSNPRNPPVDTSEKLEVNEDYPDQGGDDASGSEPEELAALLS
jgi:hypothetical protein